MSPPTTQPNLFEWNNIGGLVWGCVSSDTHPHTKPGGWGGKRSQCPRAKSSQGPKVQGFQAPRVPRYLKVLFKYELDSKEGPSCFQLILWQDVIIQCEVCDEQCLGVVSYLLHMDHHKLDVALECAQCRRSMQTYCQFYSHYCDQLQFRSCIFCEEMRMSEVNALKSPDVIDPKYLVKDAVNLFTRIIHFKDDVTIVNNEDEGFKDTGVDLVFLDFHLQHQRQKSSNVENENVTQIPIVDILDD